MVGEDERSKNRTRAFDSGCLGEEKPAKEKGRSCLRGKRKTWKPRATM